MDTKRVREAMVCPVHGEPIEMRPNGLYCKRCDRMGQHGQVVIAACPDPACGMNLLDVTRCIKGMPSIKIGWRYTEEELRDGQDHLLYVSAFWGDHTSEPDVDILGGKELDLFCPFCGREFPKVAHCDHCRAKMVLIRTRYMNNGQDGFIEVCSRRGCPEHRKGRPDERRAVVSAAAGLQFMCGAPEPDELIRGANGTM